MRRWQTKLDIDHNFLYWEKAHKFLKYLKQVIHDSKYDPADYRTIDGGGNNEDNPDLGSTNELFLRKTTVSYGNDESAPAGDERPSAREVSNALMDQDGDISNSFGASDFLWVWGQFLDHDINLTREGGNPFDIEVPQGDPFFDPFNTGTQVIHFSRSGFANGTGPGTGVPGEQVNEITSFIDGSQIYGSDAHRADYLRDPNSPGKLRMSDGEYLPYNLPGYDNAPGPMPNFYLAGDVRVNENIALTSMHTLFIREHNRLVDERAAKHPFWNGDKLYQEAKMLVEAELQSITYNEYLPTLLGKGTLDDYSGYNSSVDPSIANIFATAAFRFGHSQLSSELMRLEEDGSTIAEGNVLLRDAFFNPAEFLNSGGPESILRGVAQHTSQAIDLSMIDDVRNFLFGPPGAGGFDLASLNIQRGRDHGLPDYNTARQDYGLDPMTSFADITSDPEVQEALEDLFVSVDNIDVFVGGLAEDLHGESMLGELFTTILADQFTRLRDGDSFYYENRLDPEQIEMIEDISLSDLIIMNTDIEHMQDNPFMAYDRQGGTWGRDKLIGDEGNDLLIGEGGKDKLYGRDGDDQLYGGKGRDIIKGGDGEDVVIGGKGNDYLWGGDDADIFRFSIKEKQNGEWKMDDGSVDRIFDFSLEEGDILQFEADFDFEKPELDDMVSLHERGDDLIIKFDGGGKIVMYDVEGVSSIDDIATVDMV